MFGQQTEVVDVVSSLKANNNTIQKVSLNSEYILKTAFSKSNKITLPFIGSERDFIMNEFSMWGDVESPYKDVKSFKIVDTEDPSIKGRLIISGDDIFITYLHQSSMIRYYSSYDKGVRTYHREIGIANNEIHHSCEVHGDITENPVTGVIDKEEIKSLLKRNGSTKRVYRVALVVTGEYFEESGNTGIARSRAISNLSDISAIYENDLAIELVLSDGSPRLFSDPTSDPFDPSFGDRTDQAANAIDDLFNLNAYDVGHVLHVHSNGDGWPSGGVASRGVCDDRFDPPQKAKGWSGAFDNVSTGFISLAAHEFGHQFSAAHTWNGEGSSCNAGNFSESTAYEIASGTTIMSYQGICGPGQNIPSSGAADLYFHANSLQSIIEYVEVFVCNESRWIEDNNTPPEANANPCGIDFVLPRRTPFFIDGEGFDADGDNITYCWEQYDVDGSGATQGEIGSDAAGNVAGPLFRSFPPTTNSIRYIPNQIDVIDGIFNDDFEVLPRVPRDITMRLTVRDNNPEGGGVDWEEISIDVAREGPLTLGFPDGGETLQAGEAVEVTWELNDTESLCNQATIKASFDGGVSFPITLATGIDYAAGLANIIIPGGFSPSDQVRFMIMCGDSDCYSFYDISDDNLVVESDCISPNSVLCDDEPESFEAFDPGLNLNLATLQGSPVSSFEGELISNTTMVPGIMNLNGDCIAGGLPDNPFVQLPFQVSTAGSYNFTINFTNTDIVIYTIYDGATFDPANPCDSYLVSNATFDNGLTFTDRFNVELEPCTEYILVPYRSSNARTQISISNIFGPGSVLFPEVIPDFDFAFVATDKNTDIITDVNMDSDFRDIAPGIYDIQTISFKSGGVTPPEIVDPISFIGRTTREVLNEGPCFNYSLNSKEITVISTCTIIDIELLNQSQCDPGSNTYSQSLSFFVEQGPTEGDVTVNGQTFPITSQNVNIMLTDLVADGEPVDLIFEFSDDNGCNRSLNAVFTAPENCCPIEIDLPENILGCGTTPVELDAGPDGVAYSWTDENGVDFSNDRIISVVRTGIYTVVVDNNNCRVTRSVEVTFNDLPSLGVSSPMQIDGCDGNPELATVTSSADSIVWIQNGMEVAVNTFSYEVVASGMVEVIATNEFGCSTSASFNATFTESPIIELGDDETLCEGTPKQLTTGDSGNNYEWSLNNMILAETSNTLDVFETGTYTVISTNDEGCPSRDTVTITFTDLPDLNLGDDITQCASDPFTIVANANGFAIEWLFEGDLLIDEVDDDLFAAQSGEYIANVSAGMDCEISDTIMINYIESPEIDLGADRTECPNETVFLDGGDADNTIVWSSENQGVLPTTDNMLPVTVSDTYFLSSTNSNNCESRDTVTITFTELPMLDLGDAITVCSGEEVILEAQTNGFTIEWFFGNDLIIDEDEDNLTIPNPTVAGSGTYTAVVSANPTCSISDEVSVTFNPSPELTPINDLSPCQGDEVILTAGPDGEFDYTWMQGTATVQQGMMGSFEILFNANGQYIVTAVNDIGCESKDTAIISFIDASMINILNDTLRFCDGNIGVIEAEANALIEWFQEDVLIPNESGESLEVTQPGEYIALVGAGGTCAMSDTIQVEAIEAPEFSIEGETQACAGDLVPLTINGFNNENIVWQQGNIVQTGEISEVFVVEETATYTAILTNSTQCSSEASIDVTFFAIPENQISQIPTNLCQGNTFTVQADTDGNSFEWADENGVLEDEDELSLDITESGNYTFTSFNEIDCATITEFEVVFSPVPEADLGADVRTECIGTDVVLSVTDENGSTYQWTQDGAPFSDQSSIIVTSDDPGLYSVTVTNSSGCTATDITDISFNEPPTLVAQMDASFCAGADVTLEVDTDAAEINWLLGTDVLVSNQNTFTVDEEGLYTVEVISDEGCAISQNIDVTQNANPEISVDAIELCPDESIDIILDDNFASYEWTGITATGSSTTVDYVEVNSITTENASVKVIDSNGCEGSADFTITFFPVINAAVADEAIEICTGESAQLGASGGLMYLWDDPDGTLSDPTSDSPIATPDRTTTYDVQISDGCPGNVAELTVVVVVNDFPNADAGVDTCALGGIPFQLNATGGVEYSWDNIDVIEGSFNIPDPIINITSETTFTVTVTDDNGCIATDDVVICVNEAIEDFEPITLITPNGDGVNDVLEFRGLEAFPDNEITIFNRWGTVIFKKAGYQNDAVRWSATRDGQDLPADTYYYILTFADNEIRKSITVLRN
ncbi:gliding motility-associated C-terminal domain-containing protein [Saprospiraceae bacterium]|nr:gliding motility-associated C-terminal domain-containing protein [Saprospiraceae bacterium]